MFWVAWIWTRGVKDCMALKWKPPFLPLSLLSAIKHSMLPGNPPVKTMVRGATIIPQMIGACVEIHNGKEYVPV